MGVPALEAYKAVCTQERGTFILNSALESNMTGSLTTECCHPDDGEEIVDTD